MKKKNKKEILATLEKMILKNYVIGDRKVLALKIYNLFQRNKSANN